MAVTLGEWNIDPDVAIHVIDDVEDDFKPYGLEELSDVIPSTEEGEPVGQAGGDEEGSDGTIPQDVPDNAIFQYLKKKGIADPTKIQFENDNGETEEVDFNTMSPEDQLMVLEQLSEPDLSQHETEVVNFLRKNNETFDQVVNRMAEKKLQEYLEANPDQVRSKTYSIDQYTDDELYLADLKSKFGSFTDDELTAKLDIAKSNEELYKKEVEYLRQSYKEAEDMEIKAAEEQQLQQYEDFKNNLVDIVSGFNEVSLDYSDPESDSLVIEDGDKQQMLEYLLNQDADGRSQFIKDLDDPKAVIELAWYRTQGKDVISGISRYWKDILKAERKEIAELKKQLGSKDDKTTTVVKTQSQVQREPADKSKPVSLGDLGSRVKI